MAILNMDELFDIAFKYVDGLEQSDEAINMYNDLTTTRNELKAKEGEITDWKERYEANEKKWHERFKRQFYSGGFVNDTNQPFESPQEREERREKERLSNLTIKDLFK